MRHVWILALLAMMVSCDDGGAVGLPIDFDGGTDATLDDADVPADADADADTDADEDEEEEEEGEEDNCVVAWPDSDGDGFGANGSDPIEVCDGVIPEGYADNRWDCYDDNPDVFPGQTAFFHRDRGDGSFDYNCDGQETMERTALAGAPFICDGEIPGWGVICTEYDPYPVCVSVREPPGCGEKDAWYEKCGAGGKVIYQRCR